MKFCLISGPQGEDVKSTIISEAQKIFETVLSVSIKKVRVECIHGKTKVFYKNTDLSTFDAVYCRFFGDDFVFAQVILDALEANNVWMPTNTESYQITNHKFYTVKTVVRIGVPVPDSSLTITPKVASTIAEKMGFPEVVKLLSGFGGKGIMLVKTKEEFKPILETLTVFKEFLSTQEYFESGGEDFRALVIGDKVIGINRAAQPGEWRANVSTGGSAKIVELDEDMKEMAIKISELLGMKICAVDFLKTKDGPKLIEANFTPGIMKGVFGGKLARQYLLAIKKLALKQKPEHNG